MAHPDYVARLQDGASSGRPSPPVAARRRRRDPRLSAQDTLGQRHHIAGAVAHGADRETGRPGAAAAP